MLNNEINDKKAQEMKKENYKKYVKQKTPVHALGTNMFRAFLTGGIVCTIGEFLLNWCENMGMTKEEMDKIARVNFQNLVKRTIG